MLQYMNRKFNMEENLSMDPIKYMKLSQKLQSAYREVSYHTCIHAADVLQNVYYFMVSAGGMLQCQTTALELASLLIASAAHDVDHPGTNNLYEIKTRSKLATLYNDQSVLENHHTATLFFILDDE